MCGYVADLAAYEAVRLNFVTSSRHIHSEKSVAREEPTAPERRIASLFSAYFAENNLYLRRK